MWKYNFKYEWKQLVRSRWIQVMSILLLLLFGFAAYNGKIRVNKNRADVQEALEASKDDYTVLGQKLDSLERGLPAKPEYLQRPIAVANYYPRIAALPSNSLQFVSTGQSDMFSNYKKPTFTYGGVVEDYTEMTSPIQLLFGSFDLAFVIVYLLPLLIIALGYEVLSGERERGTLRLLGSQAISIRVWLLQKLMIRFFWLALLVLVFLTVLLLLINRDAFGEMAALLNLFGLILAYMLFWFALAFVVNLMTGSSANNAVSLLGFWIFFVLLVPSVLNQLGATLYPMPSRAQLINDVRTVEADVTKRQDEILDSYLRDHPELALHDTTQTRTYYHKYLASQKVVRDEVQPLVDQYKAQLQNQQDWIGRFKWLSPAVITQEALNLMAGTSTQDYEHFRKQVEAFGNQWRTHFLSFEYNNTQFKEADIIKLPRFEYQSINRSSSPSLWILLLALAVFGIGFLLARVTKTKLIQN